MHTPPASPRRSHTSRAGRLAAVFVAAGALALGGLQPAFATHALVGLAGSNFEIDADANLKLDDPAPSMDWATVGEARKADLPSGSGDDSFGQGASEDTAVPTVVDGSIPPNKSDLKTFGTYLEVAGATKFLHLFWHRVQDPTGTTNMDFEFNQSSTQSANTITPERTQGDLLIQYDLSNGGTHPTLWLSTWETMDKTKCQASNKVPCWSTKSNLSSAGIAAGSINTSAILDTDSDGLGAISARTFGEATVNFTALIPPGTCTSFGSAYLKSRSSDSFTSALKDFIAPLSVSINNCGSVRIVKTDDANAPLAGAEFTLYKDLGTIGGTRDPNVDVITDPVQKCTTGSAGVCTINSVLFGTYWVVETVVPTNHDPAPDTAITVTTDQMVTVTLVDPRQRGVIEITKTAKHFGRTLATPTEPNLTATFEVKKGSTVIMNGSSGTWSTDATTGKVCIPDLLFGTDYTVEEKSGQAGYQLEAGTKSVTVSQKATCSTGTKATVSFENKPLSNISVTFTPQVTGGTAASIVCRDATDAVLGSDATPGGTVFDDTAEAVTNLVEGTYTCTIVIDP